MTPPPNSNHARLLTITGDLQSASFIPWVRRHCGRLGLSFQQVQADGRHLVIEVAGQPELIDALEVGCLLGPIDVWVERIASGPLDAQDDCKTGDTLKI